MVFSCPSRGGNVKFPRSPTPHRGGGKGGGEGEGEGEGEGGEGEGKVRGDGE
jgi:hypothetical protein